MTSQDGEEEVVEIWCPYLNALRARAMLSIAYLICVVLHFFRVMFKPYTCPRNGSIFIYPVYFFTPDIFGPVQSMIMLSTSLGVGLAFLLCGSVSLNAGFHYVLVVLIFTIIHMYQHFRFPR